MGHRNPSVNPDAPCDLYRYYDENDVLLYVGISMSAFMRAQQHRAEKDWWRDVATMKREVHPTRSAALEAERLAIINEKPIHNVVHNGPRATGPYWTCVFHPDDVAVVFNQIDDHIAPLCRACHEVTGGGLNIAVDDVINSRFGAEWEMAERNDFIAWPWWDRIMSNVKGGTIGAGLTAERRHDLCARRAALRNRGDVQ